MRIVLAIVAVSLIIWMIEFEYCGWFNINSTRKIRIIRDPKSIREQYIIQQLSVFGFWRTVFFDNGIDGEMLNFNTKDEAEDFLVESAISNNIFKQD